jgi:hypothetical protein
MMLYRSIGLDAVRTMSSTYRSRKRGVRTVGGVLEEGTVGACRREADGSEQASEALKPWARHLFQSIQELVRTWSGLAGSTGCREYTSFSSLGPVHEHVFNVQLMDGPPPTGDELQGRVSTVRMVAGLTTGAIVDAGALVEDTDNPARFVSLERAISTDVSCGGRSTFPLMRLA